MGGKKQPPAGTAIVPHRRRAAFSLVSPRSDGWRRRSGYQCRVFEKAMALNTTATAPAAAAQTPRINEAMESPFIAAVLLFSIL